MATALARITVARAPHHGWTATCTCSWHAFHLSRRDADIDAREHQATHGQLERGSSIRPRHPFA